jgi:hypothetical protein
MCIVPGWRKNGEAILPLPQGMLMLGPTAAVQPEKFIASSDDKTYEEKMKIIKDAK